MSNPVGGRLISTGVWIGYRVADLLAVAGVHADADMMLSTSIDGFSAGTPVEALTDGRGALLAVGLNGQPLPIEHGYPARLVVPGPGAIPRGTDDRRAARMSDTASSRSPRQAALAPFSGFV